MCVYIVETIGLARHFFDLFINHDPACYGKKIYLLWSLNVHWISRRVRWRISLWKFLKKDIQYCDYQSFISSEGISPSRNDLQWVNVHKVQKIFKMILLQLQQLNCFGKSLRHRSWKMITYRGNMIKETLLSPLSWFKTIFLKTNKKIWNQAGKKREKEKKRCSPSN